MFLISPKRHFERVKNKNSSGMIAWTIENFSFNNCKMAVPLTSPLFIFPKEMKWLLFLYPRGNDNTTDVVLELVLQTTASGDCDYNVNLSLLTGNKSIFTNKYRMKFEDGKILSTGKLLNTDRINNCLANDTLTLQCEFSVVDDFEWLKDVDETHLESLSADLLRLYTSKKYSDLILIVNNENFHVHKSILSVRWPKLAEYLKFRNFKEMKSSVIVPNVSPEIMKDLIIYVYSGKANFNISTEMLKVINMLELLSLKDHLSELPHSYVARTVIQVERKTVVWNLGDVNLWNESQMPFIRVLPIEGIYIRQIVLTFSTANRDGEEFLRFAFKLSGFNAEKSVLLKCKFTFYDDDRTVIACASGHHLFVDTNEWDFPYFLRKSLVMTVENEGSRSKQSLEIELSMSDGKSSFNIEATDTDLYTESRSVNDLCGLKTDLHAMRLESHKRGPLCDMHICTKDGYALKVHKAILWARWPESLTVLKQNEIGIEVELDLDTLKELLHYMYYACTTMDFNPRNAQQILELNKVAKMPNLLIKKCLVINCT